MPVLSLPALRTFTFRRVVGLVVIIGLLTGCLGLLTGCSDADSTNGTGITTLPRTMMEPLHELVQTSQQIPATPALEVYVGRLLRQNYRAAIAMSALELNQGRDPDLRRLAEEVNHGHQQALLAVDSVLRQLQTPVAAPEPVPDSTRFAYLLQMATNGLAPAAHRTLERAAGGGTSANLGWREYREDAGTGSLDRDFAALLVPHHQNAISLAQAELAYGRTSRLRRLAARVSQFQQREITQAQDWLRSHPTLAEQ